MTRPSENFADRRVHTFIATGTQRRVTNLRGESIEDATEAL